MKGMTARSGLGGLLLGAAGAAVMLLWVGFDGYKQTLVTTTATYALVALGMYVPLSAVVPLLAPRHKASAVAVLNLGAGLSNFGGPLLAGLVGPLGIAPVVWILAALYVVGFFLTYLLKQPGVEVTAP